MDVRMPDGTIIRGVPEGTSKADILAKYAGSAKALAPELSSINAEIERRRKRLETGRKELSKAPTGVEAVTELLLRVTGGKTGREAMLERLEEEEGGTIEALRRRAEYIQRTGQAPRELTTGEKIAEVAKAVPRSAIRGLSDVGGTLGVFGETGERGARYVAGLGETGVEALGLTPDELAQYDPSLVRPTQVAEGFGSIVPFVASEALGKRVRIPLQALMGAGMGAAQQRREIEAQEAATGQPVSAFDRALAQASGAAIGLSEMAPIPGLVAARPGRAFQRVARSTVEEGGQETGSNIGQNVVEKLTYNPEQEISEGALESAILGGVVGGGTRGGTELVTRGREVPPEEVVREPLFPKPEVFEDNPGGDWEARKQANAERGREESLAIGQIVGSAARMVDGPSTQTIRRVEVPVEKLRTLSGVLGEMPGPGEPKYDALRKSVEENGFDRERAGLPMVFVNHKGEAYLYEGNNRVAVAAEEGVPSLPVEIQYLNGAEKAPGPFAPGRVLAEHDALSSGQIVPRETEEPSIAATAIGEAEAPAAEPVSTRPFPTSSTETADIEAPPAGFTPERETPAEVPPATPIKFDINKETFKQKAGRVLSDDMQRLVDFEEQIGVERGAPLPKQQSARDAFARYFGKATERLDEVDRDFTNPIVKKIGDLNLDQDRVNEFLVAKSAPARNAMVARVNPEMPDGGAGMSNVEAGGVIQAAQDDGIIDQLEDVAGDIYTMAKATREGMVRDGLITRAQADVWEQTQPYYVPLKGIAAAGDMSVSDEDIPHSDFNPAGFRARVKESRMAKGRGKDNLPLSPLAYTIYDAKAAAIRGEKNIAANKFLDLVEANPSNAWQVFTKESPDTEMVPDPNTGILRRQAVNMAARPDQYFLVKREGKPFYIKINDPLLMRALTNGSAKSTQGLVQFLNDIKIAPATRTLSRLFTTYNPVFAGVNYTRDMTSAIFNILAEQDRVDGRLAGKEIAGGVLRDMANPNNFRKIAKITFNKEATTEEERAMFDMFQQAKEDGAFTGWVVNEPVQQKIEDIQSALDQASAKGGKKAWYETKKGAEKVLQSLQDFNSVFENITRFSVYKNALGAGLTREEAASMAREVTVDFNKKGEVGSLASTLYAFVNASIQGNTRLWRSITGRKADGGMTRAQKMAVTLMGMGAMQSLLGRALSDDDEDGKSFYDKIPEYEKQRNIIIPHPWTGGKTYSKLPLPYGISVFYNFGTNAADFATDNATAPELGLKTMSSVMNNFSPISIGFNSPSGFAMSFAPTVAKPVGDLLINENYFGSKIYNEPFNEGEALSSVPRYSTPEGYKIAAQYVNEITGGKGAKAGWGDYPAEAIPYLLGQYTGGAGRFGLEVASLAKSAATGDLGDVSPNDIPFSDYAVSEVNEKAGLGDYYERSAAIGPLEKQLRDSTGAAKAELRKDFPVETNPRVIAAKKETANKIKGINKQIKALDDAQDSDYRERRLDALNEQKTKAITTFNRVYNQVEERAR
jgi:hypothetical protein